MNIRATTDINWSVKTEVLIDDEDSAEEAGREAAAYLSRFQNGMVQGFERMADEGTSDE
jgi:hypothetical protein